MAIKHPETFEAPDLNELRLNLEHGDLVKVCISDALSLPNAERPWVVVTERYYDRCGNLALIRGTLANDPIMCSGEFGDEVEFRPEHVYCHMTEEAMAEKSAAE